jgi:acyl-CoA hydrolase
MSTSARSTALCESDDPIFEVGLPKIGPVQEAIGKYVADMIPDGATLQIGYGGIPDAVVMQLTDKRDLGIHTEMVGDGIMTLVEAGVITNRRKNYHHGKMLATFALGSKKLYQFMNRNPALEMHPVEFHQRSLHLAGQNDNLHAVNATMQVDFMGQCGSESLGYTPYSGTGGQSDFVRAANRSQRRQVFHRPAVDRQERHHLAHPANAPAGHACVDRQERHQLCGHRVRRRGSCAGRRPSSAARP